MQNLQDHLSKLFATYSSQNSPDAACPQSEQVQENEEATTFPVLRGLVAMSLLVVAAASVYFWHNMDQLSEKAPMPIAEFFGLTENPRRFSEVLAYKADRWFSTNKHAKVLALLFFTLLLVGVGSLALFAVSNASMYEALWSSLAGVGVDWTFSQDFHLPTGFSSVIGRIVSMIISLGGLLVTALLLSIVSGKQKCLGSLTSCS